MTQATGVVTSGAVVGHVFNVVVSDVVVDRPQGAVVAFAAVVNGAQDPAAADDDPVAAVRPSGVDGDVRHVLLVVAVDVDVRLSVERVEAVLDRLVVEHRVLLHVPVGPHLDQFSGFGFFKFQFQAKLFFTSFHFACFIFLQWVFIFVLIFVLFLRKEQFCSKFTFFFSAEFESGHQDKQKLKRFMKFQFKVNINRKLGKVFFNCLGFSLGEIFYLWSSRIFAQWYFGF